MSATDIIPPPELAKPATMACRLGSALTVLIPLAVFAISFSADSASAIAGMVASVVFGGILYRFWGRLSLPAMREQAIVFCIVVYGAFVAVYLEGFSLYPWSTFSGLVSVVLISMMVAVTWKETRKAPITAKFGLIIIALNILMVCIAPILAPHGQSQVLGGSYLVWGTPFSDGGTAWLGTDELGRDYLSRMIFAIRNTVGIAIVTTALTFIVGAFVGLLAASLRGWVDQGLSRMVDVLMAIPPLIFALLILTVVGTGVVKLVLVIALLDSTRVFRLSRSVAMNIVVMDYVEAAKLRGEKLMYVIWREVLPNAAAPLIAEFGLRFCFVFLFISSLSFLGLGLQPPTADLGSMVRDSANLINFYQFNKLMAITPLLPACAIALLTIAVNFVVDWFLHKTSGLKE
ncbi:ABC transporter permease [Hwanghaeella sp. 1Z406]|jgi:peptide/nickel transport system permease protein|uniref:ABC transporter permease n=1 Tax=Hwanghaeella sp. 1Z406 TaxID=3402811 RepID=UPI003B673197|tara:strand:- start:22566 stop:23774 length:1209 start_codon:yes stop_codon:yes gene_type:complete